MGDKRVHIKVVGMVQGVFFRMHTQEVASNLGLKGWVRNMPDGCVEVIAEGDPEKLKELEKWCNEGPPSSHVTGVKASYLEPTGEFDTFKIRYYE